LGGSRLETGPQEDPETGIKKCSTRGTCCNPREPVTEVTKKNKKGYPKARGFPYGKARGRFLAIRRARQGGPSSVYSFERK